MVTPSDMAPWRMPHMWWARGSPIWGGIRKMIDLCIKHQLKGWEKEDDPPSYVNPTPLLIMFAMTITLLYLLHLGEYTATTNDDTALCICDVQLWIGTHFTCPITAPLAEIAATTSAYLIFTTQQNRTEWNAQ
jgi:hypothetical protein